MKLEKDASQPDEPVLRSAITLVLDTLLPELAAVQQQYHQRAVETGMPLHVTLLHPFVSRNQLDAEISSRLADYVASIPAFTLSFDRIDEFPGVIYAAPRPSSELDALMCGVWRMFPDTPPYGGAFDDPVPHATLAIGGADDQERLTSEIRERTASMFPRVCVVRATTLMEEYVPDRWRERERFPFAQGSTIVDLSWLGRALEHAWQPDTAYQEVVVEGNPAYGQCYPTARLVQLLLPEAELVHGWVRTGDRLDEHYWNQLSGHRPIDIDLTWQQFGYGAEVVECKILDRSFLNDSAATLRRCDLLHTRMLDALGDRS